MQPYLDALHAMHDLLGALGEKHWRSWIAEDITAWETHQSVQHHLGAYGGMGSFNDIAFAEPWLGELFDDLKSACYYFAHHPTNKPDTRALEQSMGSTGFVLSGWRCLACGHSAVSHRDIVRFAAYRVIRKRILAEAANTNLRGFVASVIRAHPSDPELTPERVAEWVRGSGLQIRDNDASLRPCPSCGSNHTAIYRWILNKTRHHFVPSPDNLPLRA